MKTPGFSHRLSSLRAGNIDATHFIHPRTLMAIRNLELRAKIVVDGFWNGLHRSPYHGFSVEFSEYRQYSPGDDPRYLDWKVFARRDRYYVKKFEDETNLRCHLLIDKSRSMEYASGPLRKVDYANTLAATLAYFLYLQGDAVGVLSFDEEIREFLPARNRTGHLRQIMLRLDKPTRGKSTDLDAPLRRIVQLVRKRGLMVLISDLLTEPSCLEGRLASLVASRHEVQVFQILDPAEKEFTFEKASLFRDMESGQQLYIDPASARKRYLERMTHHLATIEAMCMKLGVGYQWMTSDTPLEWCLFHFLRSRSQRPKTILRQSSSQGRHA